MALEHVPLACVARLARSFALAWLRSRVDKRKGRAGGGGGVDDGSAQVEPTDNNAPMLLEW